MLGNEASRDEQSPLESAEGLRGKIQRRTPSQRDEKGNSERRSVTRGKRRDRRSTLTTCLVALLLGMLFWGVLATWFWRAVAAANLGIIS